VHTRADDLLARFGASCADDPSGREAAACLRRMAGIDPTPPPAKVEIRVSPPPAPEPDDNLALIPSDAETPISPRVRARRPSALPGLGFTLAVLVLGLAGGTALVRFRPDLFGITHGAPTPVPAAPKFEPAAEAPAPTAEPRGAIAPTWTPSNGARAELRPAERSR
jgi:hypothetical protein